MSLQLEVGKTYKDREGTLVTITCKTAFACTYPYYGDNSAYYMPDGRYREYDLYHDNDLIEEVSTPMFGTTWTFPNFKQVVGVPTLTEETKMQDQIITINCTLVVRDIEGTLTLQVHPKDEFWRADATTTVLDTNFELVLPRAKVEELYTQRLLAKVQKADQDYKEALEAFDTAKTFLDNL
jgi:hypothetical protein